MSRYTPKVGDRVKLSNFGYADLRLGSREAFEQAEDMVITEVANMGTVKEPIYAVEVNQPLINFFLLHDEHVEPI
jgi:hypothetical protein